MPTQAVCPCCGESKIQKIPSRSMMSVNGDRECKGCGAKWSPAVSKRAAATIVFASPVLFLLATLGGAMVGGGLFAGLFGGFVLFAFIKYFLIWRKGGQDPVVHDTR